jgi:hypothetical protein
VKTYARIIYLFLIAIAFSRCTGDDGTQSTVAPQYPNYLITEGCAGYSNRPISTNTVLPSSGDPNIDQFMNAEYNNIARFFALAPKTNYFDDSDGPNAYFIYKSNSIVLGVRLVNTQCTNSFSGCNNLPFILAH